LGIVHGDIVKGDLFDIIVLPGDLDEAVEVGRRERVIRQVEGEGKGSRGEPLEERLHLPFSHPRTRQGQGEAGGAGEGLGLGLGLGLEQGRKESSRGSLAQGVGGEVKGGEGGEGGEGRGKDGEGPLPERTARQADPLQSVVPAHCGPDDLHPFLLQGLPCQSDLQSLSHSQLAEVSLDPL